jgi:hypothetical protein
MKIKELFLSSEDPVNTLAEEINLSNMSLKETEEKIVQFINRICQIMTDEVIACQEGLLAFEFPSFV